MSDEPTTVTTQVQEALDVHEPSISNVPGSAPAGDDDGEESDTYDDFDAEDNKDYGEFAGGEYEEDDEDGDDGEEFEEEGGTVKKSNLTALLLNDPNAGGATGNADEDEDEDEDDEDADEDDEYNEEQEEPEVVAVQANGNGKKRTIDDVNSDEVGVEADEREAAAKKVKA